VGVASTDGEAVGSVPAPAPRPAGDAPGGTGSGGPSLGAVVDAPGPMGPTPTTALLPGTMAVGVDDDDGEPATATAVAVAAGATWPAVVPHSRPAPNTPTPRRTTAAIAAINGRRIAGRSSLITGAFQIDSEMRVCRGAVATARGGSTSPPSSRNRLRTCSCSTASPGSPTGSASRWLPLTTAGS
jgi:hypothetical protein